MTQVNVNLTNNKINYRVNTTVQGGKEQCLCLQVIKGKKKIKKKLFKSLISTVTYKEATLLAMPLFHSLDFGFLEKTLHGFSKIFVEHALVLLGYSFEPRLNSRASGTEGSDMAIGLSKNECSQSEKQCDERKQDCPA